MDWARLSRASHDSDVTLCESRKMKVIILLLLLKALQTSYSQSEGDVRLSTMLTNSGRLDVYWAGAWSTVCAEGMTQSGASAACRQLGYFEVFDHFPRESNASSLPVAFSNVDCGSDYRAPACDVTSLATATR